MAKPVVGVLMGSDSDLPVMEHTLATLEKLAIPHEVDVISAHRTPEKATRYGRTAERRGLKVIIAGAGGAAHLAGVLAAHTSLPVIGVPMPTSALAGADSLYSTVQMPAGVPVATVAIGKGGATNAAILAAQILATASPALRRRLKRYKANLVRKVAAKAAAVKKRKR